jgi:membrane-associated HD superfamily phosphohydrolase
MNSAVQSAMPAIREQVENDSADTEKRLETIARQLEQAFQAYAFMMMREAEYTQQRVQSMENLVSSYLEASRKFAKGEDFELYWGVANRVKNAKDFNSLVSSKRDSQDQARELSERIAQLEAATNHLDQERGNVDRSEKRLGSLGAKEATPEKPTSSEPSS